MDPGCYFGKIDNRRRTETNIFKSGDSFTSRHSKPKKQKISRSGRKICIAKSFNKTGEEESARSFFVKSGTVRPDEEKESDCSTGPRQRMVQRKIGEICSMRRRQAQKNPPNVEKYVFTKCCRMFLKSKGLRNPDLTWSNMNLPIQLNFAF